jgi:hypothetical protein
MSMSSPERSPGAALDRPTEQQQRLARIAGVLFVITFVTSIPALLLFDPVLNDRDYITGAGSETRVLLGAFLELLLIIANIGTALALFPILKRQNEALALGYVAARVVECMFIGVGILSVLAVVTLRQDLAGTGSDPATLETVGRSLVAVKDWTFLLGPGFVVGVGNGLMLGYLMYRSGLVPQGMAMLGSLEVLSYAPRESRSCSAPSNWAPRRRPSRRSRSSFGSCRLASISPSRASRRPRPSSTRPAIPEWARAP